jgi:hypothetical protein
MLERRDDIADDIELDMFDAAASMSPDSLSVDASTEPLIVVADARISDKTSSTPSTPDSIMCSRSPDQSIQRERQP